MLALMDAFTEAVEEARARLDRAEGRTISTRELARRAGIPERTLAYNLSEERSAARRRIDPGLVRKLAPALRVPEADLMRAAQTATGYQVREDPVELPDLRGTIVRYLAQDVSREDRLRVLAELQEILAEEMRKVTGSE